MLECDADDMTYELPDGIVEIVHTGNVFGVFGRQNLRPEQFKVAFLQNVGQKDDFDDGVVFHLLWQQQTFAQREVGVRQVGQRFQQNQIGDFQIQEFRIELVQFEDGQICLQIVFVVLRLFANIIFQRLQMFRIVSVHGMDTQIVCIELH